MSAKVIDKLNPRFTVIIPTKDRAEFLQHTLRTCMMQDYDNLKIIVSDDCSIDNTEEVVREASRIDPRITYYKNSTAVGMKNNFEFALEQVEPGYVIALGSDDGLLPNGIIGMRDSFASTGLELLSWPAPEYFYPDVRGSNSLLAMYYRQTDKIINSDDYLANQTNHFNYLTDTQSPMFYVKGVTSTNLINRVRSRTKHGKFYSCPTPDGYSGIVLSGEVRNFAFSGKPFSIYGMTLKSQGLNYLSNDNTAKKVSNQFYQSVESTPMHIKLASQPYSPLITLMTADYLLTVQDLPGWPGRVPSIDFKKILWQALSELACGFYTEERLLRELNILKAIAGYHDLDTYFGSLIEKQQFKKIKKPFCKTGVGPKRIFLDGVEFNFRNIVDASYAVYTAQALIDNLKPSKFCNMVVDSLKYYITKPGKGGRFPSLD